MNLQNLTLSQAITDLKEKKYSSEELTRAYLERIKEVVSQRQCDVVILDLPVHSDIRFEAFSGVNQALLVAEQSVPAIRAS